MLEPSANDSEIQFALNIEDLDFGLSGVNLQSKRPRLRKLSIETIDLRDRRKKLVCKA